MPKRAACILKAASRPTSSTCARTRPTTAPTPSSEEVTGRIENRNLEWLKILRHSHEAIMREIYDKLGSVNLRWHVYLTISVGILMVITSVGIYGFLSNAYQSTANKLEIHEGELGV